MDIFLLLHFRQFNFFPMNDVIVDNIPTSKQQHQVNKSTNKTDNRSVLTRVNKSVSSF
jgi:hypothetical protein